MIANRDLKAAFNRLNRQYFRGKLNMQIRFDDLSDIDAIGVCHRNEIEIDHSLKKAGWPTVEITLLHEMVHAEMFHLKGHGRKFHARINQLFRQGAYKGLL